MPWTDEELDAAYDSQTQAPTAQWSEEELDAAYNAANPQSWGNFALNLGKSGVKGATDFLGFVSDYNPFTGMPAITRPVAPSTQIEEERLKYIGAPEYQSRGGRIAGKVAEYLPTALIPGGGSLKARSLFAALSGLGGGTAEELGAPEIAGAIGLPVGAGLAAKGIGSAYRGVKGLFSPDLTAQADEIAREVLSKHTDVPALVKALEKVPEGEFSPYMRTAEKIQSPGLSLLTKTLEKNIPEAEFRGGALDEAREAARLNKFLGAQGPVYSDEKVGTLIREGLAENEAALSRGIGKAYGVAEAGSGTIPIQKVKIAASDALANQAKFGIGVNPSTASIINTFRELPPNVPMSQAQAYRSQIGSMIGDLRTNLSRTAEDNASLGVLSKIFGALDEAERFALTPEAQGITKTGVKKGIGRWQGKAVEKGRELVKERGETFRKGVSQQVLKQDAFKEYTTPASRILPKVISGPEEARQVMKGLRSQNRGQDALRSGLLETLKEKSTDYKDVFTAARFKNNWDALKPVAKEVLSPGQIKVVDQVKRDLLSRARFDELAGKASKGQSVTAQHVGAAAFVKDAISQGAKSRLGIVSRVFSAVGESRAEKIKSMVDETLVEIAFDEKFANDFLSKTPSKESVSRLTSEVFTRMGLTGVAGSQDPKEQKPFAWDQSKPDSENLLSAAKMASDKVKPMETPKIVIAKRLEITDKHLDALAMTESNRNPKAVSPVGAKGEYQFMPATAKEYGVDLEDGSSEDDRLGAKAYLEKYVKKFGSIELALASYNAGPTAVEKWIKRFGTKDWSVISQRLKDKGAYLETVNYVPRFMKNLKILEA